MFGVARKIKRDEIKKKQTQIGTGAAYPTGGSFGPQPAAPAGIITTAGSNPVSRVECVDQSSQINPELNLKHLEQSKTKKKNSIFSHL